MKPPGPMDLMRKAARCIALLGFTALGLGPVLAQNTVLMTAGNGSAFLPYGQGVAAYLASKGITIEVKQSAGSNENLLDRHQASVALMTIQGK
jgi:uncharacterized protein